MRRIKNTLEHLLKFKNLTGEDALLTDFDFKLIKGTIEHLDDIQKEFKQSFFKELSESNPELFNTHTAKGRLFISRYHKYMDLDIEGKSITEQAFKDIPMDSEIRVSKMIIDFDEQIKLDLD
jgi:hypothetical protein